MRFPTSLSLNESPGGHCLFFTASLCGSLLRILKQKCVGILSLEGQMTQDPIAVWSTVPLRKVHSHWVLSPHYQNTRCWVHDPSGPQSRLWECTVGSLAEGRHPVVKGLKHKASTSPLPQLNPWYLTPMQCHRPLSVLRFENTFGKKK